MRNTAQVPAGATVAVIGCGGVGLSVVQGARLAGAAKIVAVDLSADKLAVARRLGATGTVDASQAADPVAALRDAIPEGLDFVFDAIGRIETTEQAIAALGLGGAAVIVGLPPTGRTARFDPLALAEANQRILGSNYGSVDPQRDIPGSSTSTWRASSTSTRSSPAAGRSTRPPRRLTTSRRGARSARS